MFEYKNNLLHWQKYNLTEIHQQIQEILQKKYNNNTAYFLYNQDILEEYIQYFCKTLPNLKFYYSVKSNSNIHLLKILRQHPQFGVDVVSKGEIIRSQHAGFEGQDIVFAGVGKTKEEILYALKQNIHSFHVESVSEMKAIAKIAESENKVANITLRINPDIPVKTHSYIQTSKHENKFGISKLDYPSALNLIEQSSYLNIIGLQVHLGSQLLDSTPYIKALDYLIDIYKNIPFQNTIQYASLGGGFGVNYDISPLDNIDSKSSYQSKEFPLKEFANNLQKYTDLPFQLAIEPGRLITAYSGIIISKVLYIKQKQDFLVAILDTGMTELLRPSLYQSYHPVVPLRLNSTSKEVFDIVGPICESGDFFKKKVSLPPLKEGDFVAILHTGAYGTSMSSNYNSRPFLSEALISNEQFKVIKRPQTYEELFSLETTL